MKKLLMVSALALSFAVTGAQAIKVKSGSNYPVVVDVYEWKSVCKDKGSNAATKAFKGAAKAFRDGGVFSALRESVSAAVTNSGCNKIGSSTILFSKGRSMEVPAGTMIVAYKHPVLAYKTKKKIVNPLPAITPVPDSGTLILETRKSEGLASFIGFKGDFGLKATRK